MIKKLKLHAALLLIISTFPCNAEDIVKENLTNSSNFSQLEKDVDACEVGKTYYEKCDFSNYDNTYYSNPYYDNDWIDTFEEKWDGGCFYGEKKASLGWFNKEHDGYIRSQDIEDCMSEKGYIKNYGKWIKNRNGFVYFGNQWLTIKDYIKLHTGIRGGLNSETGIPGWESRIYPRDKCYFKYLPDKAKDYRCDESGEYYQGKGEYIGDSFYPDVIMRDLSKSGLSIGEIKNHLTGSILEVKAPKEAKESIGKNLNKPKASVKIFEPKADGVMSYIEELRKIKDLFDSKIIDRNEFKIMKQKVIDRL